MFREIVDCGENTSPNARWDVSDMAWTEPRFSKGEFRRAGELLQATDPADLFYPVGWDHAVDVIDNWRSSHGYPLQVMYMTLRARARGVARRRKSKSIALVTQRRKRFESIWKKLRLNPLMSLTQMQDVGGCRAVMRSMLEVRQLVGLYEKGILLADSTKPECCEKYDYIDDAPGPKDSGYRSMHYVYKYRGGLIHRECYSGLRIEIQIRSQLQHAWATAVETVDALTKQALKSNLGDEHWMRFFALMGSVIAMRERSPLVPNTPTKRKELYEEVRSYAEALHVFDVLSGYGMAVFSMIGPEEDAGAYLLKLDPAEKTIDVESFPKNAILEAEQRYAEIEKELDRDRGMQAVLVTAESVAELRRAYPNYFLDTRAFLAVLQRILPLPDPAF